MSKLVGRKPIEINNNDLKDGRIPVYDGDRRLWTTSNEVEFQTVESNELRLNAGTVSMVFTGSITSGVFGVSEYVMPYISTTDYSGTTVEYLAQRPDATRMGLIMATWSGSNVVFTDISTADIGDTKDIAFTFIQNNDEFRLRVTSNGSGSGAWTVQSLFRLFPNLL
jgi:hypothetical protein